MAKRRSEPPAPSEGAFEEAIEWHRRKLAIRKEDWEQLETRAQKRAFTAAGVARLNVLDDVMKAIDKALADGESMDDFKKRVQAKLEKEWGGPIPGRVENIFRTNVQHAYSHGRYSQLEDPDLIAIRPYRKFTSVMDLRTSDICRPLNGIILPANDIWWRTHLPPLHFQCRSAIISLRREVALEAGVTKKPPTAEAQKGFGSAVGYEWKPDLAAKDKKLVEVYRRQQKKTSRE